MFDTAERRRVLDGVLEVTKPSAGAPDPRTKRGSFYERGLLGLVLLGALALRLLGLPWGLPRVDFNPDESTVLSVAAHLSWSQWDPGVYFYSGFSFHLLALVRLLAQLLWPGVGDPTVILLSRGVSVAFGTASIGVLYVLLHRLNPRGPAPLLGAAFLALMPLHVWDSHFATTDVTLTFWMLAAVTASVWAYQEPSWRRFTIASALVGVATGVKFNGAMAAPAVAIAGLLAVWERRLSLGRLVAWGVAGLAAAIGALFLASPYTFIQWQRTWAAFQHEMSRVHGDYGFDLWVPGWQYRPFVYQFAAAFPFSFGIALYAAILAGCGYCALHFRRVLLIPLGYGAIYLGAFGRWEFVPIRYYLPMEPVLLIPPALALAAGLAAPASRLRRLAVAGLVLVLVYTTLFTISTTARFRDDTRLQAQRWLNQRVAEGRRVLTVGATWYLPVPGPDPERVENLLNYGAMPTVVQREWPDYVVLTGLHYIRSYRARDAKVELWDTIRRGVLPYRLEARFQARYLNWRFYRKLDPMYEGYFISPTIEVYRRRS